MTVYEKDSFIDVVEATLDYNEPVSEEDYALYEELIKERSSKQKFQEIIQILDKCKEIPQPYQGTSEEKDTRLKQGEAEIALELGIPIFAVSEAEGYHGSDAGYHDINRIESKEELIRYTALLSGYRNMAILQPNYPEEEQRVIADYLRDVYEERSNIENKKYVIEKSKHTKTGEDIWLVRMNDKLERDDFLQEKEKMKELGGYYSKYTHSFVFKEDPSDKLNKNSLNSQINESTQEDMSEEDIYNNIYEYETLINMPVEERITLEQRGKGWNLERSNENIKDYTEYARKCKKYLKDNLFQINTCEEVSYYLLSDLAEYHAHPHDTVQGVKIEKCEINSITFKVSGYEHDDGSHESYSETKTWTLDKINEDLKDICLTHYWKDSTIKYLKEQNQIKMIGILESKLEIPENERMTKEVRSSNKAENSNEISYLLRFDANSKEIEKRYEQLWHYDENKKTITESKIIEKSVELPDTLEEWKKLDFFEQARLVHEFESVLPIPDTELITSYFGDMGEYEFKYGLSEQEIFERYSKLRELSSLSQKIEGVQLGNFEWDEDNYLHFSAEVDGYELEGLFRTSDPQNGEDMKLVSIDYGYNHSQIKEQWDSIEEFLKEYSADRYKKLNKPILKEKLQSEEDKETTAHDMTDLERRTVHIHTDDTIKNIAKAITDKLAEQPWGTSYVVVDDISVAYQLLDFSIKSMKNTTEERDYILDIWCEDEKIAEKVNVQNAVETIYQNMEYHKQKNIDIPESMSKEENIKLNDDFKLNQVSVRLNQETPLYSDKAIKNAEDAVKIVGQELMANLDREQICIINLNTQNNPINFSIASVGTLNNALAEPREMLKASILSNAGSVIMLHNHPSGNYYPSVEDYQVTERIIKSFDSVGIKVLDHVIIAGNNIDDYYSMREENVKMFEESPVLTGKLEFSDISEHLLHKINVFLVAEDLSYWINNTHSTISLTDKEAELILNYMDGHGYNLGVENENLVRIDVEEETPTAEKYNINEAIYAVCDWNAELISETNENINNAASVEEVCKLREYMKALRADESVIDAMFKKTSLGKTLELGTEKQEEKKTEHKKEKVI